MSHEKKHHQPAQVLSGTFSHLIFSPKGAIEGLLMEMDGHPHQMVIEPDHGGSPYLAKLRPGQSLKVEAEAAGPSHKGEAEHPVYHLHRVVSINGRKATTRDVPTSFSGIVERFNFAKHGQANGVVLDSGDFIHLKPDGMTASGLKLGDKVSATGESRPLASGTGHVVEAREINGRKIKHGSKHAK